MRKQVFLIGNASSDCSFCRAIAPTPIVIVFLLCIRFKRKLNKNILMKSQGVNAKKCKKFYFDVL